MTIWHGQLEEKAREIHSILVQNHEDSATRSVEKAELALTAVSDLTTDATNEDRETAVGDMLTDLIHFSMKHDLDFEMALLRARDMVVTENREWSAAGHPRSDELI